MTPKNLKIRLELMLSGGIKESNGVKWIYRIFDVRSDNEEGWLHTLTLKRLNQTVRYLKIIQAWCIVSNMFAGTSIFSTKLV